jgi:uncharacterized protein YjiS (DUF1127 family)
MATFIDSFHSHAGSSSANHAHGLLERIGAYFAARRQRAQILRELSEFDERDLHDLGINRGDFDSIVNGTYRRG